MFTITTLLTGLRSSLLGLRAGRTPRSDASILERVFTVEPCRVPVPVPMPVPRRGLRLSMVAGLLGCAMVAGAPAPCGADSPSRSGLVADGRLVDVQVQVEGRGTAPLFLAPGRWDRRYFQAFQGRNYSLVLRNNSSRRIGVLIAVDGLNAINGTRSAHSRHEPMYVLDPYERAVIRGWRTSLDHVRRFVFVDEERSYAERTGQANRDMGWIRVLAFRELRPHREEISKIREQDHQPEPYGAVPEAEGRDATSDRAKRERSAPQAGSQETAPGAPEALYGQRDDNESNPGTGWGQKQWDRVNRTEFLAEAAPVDRIILRYEYASGLRALGIRIRNPRDRAWERENGDLGFAQPPRW